MLRKTSFYSRKGMSMIRRGTVPTSSSRWKQVPESSTLSTCSSQHRKHKPFSLVCISGFYTPEDSKFFLLVKSRYSLKAGNSSLSLATVSRDDWLLSVTLFVGHAIYIICWLIWERTIAAYLNLSWTEAVCQIDSYGWTINWSPIFQNGYVKTHYLRTKIIGVQ